MGDESPYSLTPGLARSATQALANALARGFWNMSARGLENIPASGPVIVAANHIALVDGVFLILAASLRRYTLGLAKAELYRIPLLGWYLKRAGVIPVDRKGDVLAMRHAIAVLRAGACLALFPEGTRSKTGQPLPPRAGVGFLAGHSGALVVPARLISTDRWPFTRRVEVRFGLPLGFQGDVNDRRDCQAFARKVMASVFAL